MFLYEAAKLLHVMIAFVFALPDMVKPCLTELIVGQAVVITPSRVRQNDTLVFSRGQHAYDAFYVLCRTIIQKYVLCRNAEYFCQFIGQIIMSA